MNIVLNAIDFRSKVQSGRGSISLTVRREMVHKGLGVGFTNVLCSDCRATYILSTLKYYRDSSGGSRISTCFRLGFYLFGVRDSPEFLVFCRLGAMLRIRVFPSFIPFTTMATTALNPGHLISSKHPHTLLHLPGKKVQPSRLFDLV